MKRQRKEGAKWMGDHCGWGQWGSGDGGGEDLREGTPSGGGGVGGAWRRGLLALESEPAGSVSAALPSTVKLYGLQWSTQVVWSSHQDCLPSYDVVKRHHTLWWQWQDQNRLVKAAFFKGSASERVFSTTWLCLNNVYSFENVVKYKVHQGADKNLAFQK